MSIIASPNITQKFMIKEADIMNKKDKVQDTLCKKLGKEYVIRNIDFERCIYRDFGNGFSVEISCTHTTSTSTPATLYFWFGAGSGPAKAYNVSIVSDIPRNIIGELSDALYEYSKTLINKGYVTMESLVHMVASEEYKDIPMPSILKDYMHF